MILALLLAATAPAAHDTIVARVGDEVVTASQLAERITTTRARGGNAPPEDLVEDLVNEVVMASEGARLGLERDPAVVKKVAAERQRLAAERFVEKEVEAVATFDDARLVEMYHLSADTIHLEQIVLTTKEEAEAALERLHKGAKLAEEAKRSVDPAGVARGGDLGSRSRGQLDRAIEEVAFQGPLDVFAGPVQLAVGWAVVRVTERNIGDAGGFAAKKEELRRFAERQARSQTRRHYISQLRKKDAVKIDEAFLKSTGTRLEGKPDEADHVVATAAGKPIRYRDVASELRRVYNGAEGGHFSGLAVKTEIAWALVDRALIEAEAMARGYGKDPAVAVPVLAFERNQVVRAFAARLRDAAAAPSGEDVTGYYRAHLADFTRPARVRCAHILFPDREQAETVRLRLERGEPFDDMAREYSKDTATAIRGGLVGDLTDENVGALAIAGETGLAGAFRDAKPEEVSAPVKSKDGWHLIRCGPRIAASAAPFDEVRDAITARLTTERRDDAVRRRIADLRSKVPVAVDATAVRRVSAELGSKGS